MHILGTLGMFALTRLFAHAVGHPKLQKGVQGQSGGQLPSEFARVAFRVPPNLHLHRDAEERTDSGGSYRLRCLDDVRERHCACAHGQHGR